MHGSFGDIEILDPRQDNVRHTGHISIMTNVLQFIHLHINGLNKIRQIHCILAGLIQEELEIERLIVIVIIAIADVVDCIVGCITI
jgi:hypothetical protein